MSLLGCRDFCHVCDRRLDWYSLQNFAYIKEYSHYHIYFANPYGNMKNFGFVSNKTREISTCEVCLALITPLVYPRISMFQCKNLVICVKFVPLDHKCILRYVTVILWTSVAFNNLYKICLMAVCYKSGSNRDVSVFYLFRHLTSKRAELARLGGELGGFFLGGKMQTNSQVEH